MKQELKFINDDAALLQFCTAVQADPWLAVDTEFERTNTYYPALCLVQVANHDQVVVIDPLAMSNLEPLYDLLYDPAIIKVFHAARQDLEIFFHIKGTLPEPLFDTQVAATVLGYDKDIGYANLVKATLGVELEKTQTRTNWKRRPLTQSQLDYAADDVIYLARVYELFRGKLTESGQLSRIEAACAELGQPGLYHPDPDTMWQKIRAARHMEGSILAVLKQLAAWREVTARAENQPRKWILQDGTLIDMARLLPDSTDALSQIKGMNDSILKRHGDALLAIIGTAEE